MNGFLVFGSEGEQQQFLVNLQADSPDLASKLSPTRRRPRLIVEDATVAEVQLLKSKLSGSGRWFDDIQFRPTIG